MTVDEFKKAKPELAHLEGNDLADAMEQYFLRLNDGYNATKHVLPFWKRYTFRWIFYRSRQNWRGERADYTARHRCAVCKKPTGLMFGYSGKVYCVSGHEYKEELNTSLPHRLWVIWCYITKAVFVSLDWLHILRYSFNDRYGMFGDEAMFVKHWIMNYDTGKTTWVLKKRKWWQHIFIERKFHPKF